MRKQSNNVPELASPENSFYVVGIGASAGGLEALERFFKHVSENSGMAYIVVTHLDPNHVSIMPELLQKSTGMKLLSAEDGMIVQPNHVYVAPPNRDLALLRGTIQLIEPTEGHGFRLPIDYFFKSLSLDFGERAICIILSGMASDGTAGLKSVKSELGMVMVQDPSSAKFDGMPSSAIKTGLVDFILPVEEMPDRLIKYASQKVKGVLLDRAITDSKIPDTFQKIFILLRHHTGHDFSQYKQNTIYRRVERRIIISQLDSLPNYIRMLQDNPVEIDSLFRELLIGVTNFFRDSQAFEKLKKVLSGLVNSKPANDHIRIWVPGCSTGEEAYSVAILLRECMNEAKKEFSVQIFATDIDGIAIEKARVGSFTGIASEVSKERLNRFFTPRGDKFQIRKEIREMVIFAQQSVIKDPPFTKLDLISCRNLLIYFNAELQKSLIPIFHYSLVPNGILFLGSSETINAFVDLFSIVDNKWKLYKRRDSVYSAQPFMGFPMLPARIKHDETYPKKVQMKNIVQIAEKIILERYSPNCVIITANGDIQYIHGRTGKYLELPRGEAKMNIYEMARKGLQQELSMSVRRVLSGKKSVTVEGIKIKTNGRSQIINLTVQPIKEPKEMSGSLLVIFEDALPRTKAANAKSIHYTKKSKLVLQAFERELKATKERLESTIEELETSNEELKSTNEEIQSTSEEMQSSNEELESSKEELQSLNEELITVNTELQNKNDDLSAVNNDLKNLLEGIDVPTIFLDINLCIRRFTFHAGKLLNIIASDVGRPINHIATNLEYDTLIEDANEVLRTLVKKEIQMQTKEGIWHQMRILPYRTTDNVIDGLVITFTPIHQLKTAYEHIHKLSQDVQLAREYSDNIVDTVRDALLILDEDLKALSANRAFYKLFNTVSEQTVGKYVYDLDNKCWEIPELRELLEQILPHNRSIEDYEFEYDSGSGGRKYLSLNAREIFQGDKKTKLILLAIKSHNIVQGNPKK